MSGAIAFELFLFLTFFSVMDVGMLMDRLMVGLWMLRSRLWLLTFADGVYQELRTLAIFFGSWSCLFLKEMLWISGSWVGCQFVLSFPITSLTWAGSSVFWGFQPFPCRCSLIGLSMILFSSCIMVGVRSAFLRLSGSSMSFAVAVGMEFDTFGIRPFGINLLEALFMIWQRFSHRIGHL